MNLVRESITFQRGLDPKQALDVGVKRAENIGDFIERGLESHLSQFAPKSKYSIVRDDGSKHWVKFYEGSTFHLKPFSMDTPYTVSIGSNNRFWTRDWKLYFKVQVKSWFNENEFEITRLAYSERLGAYIVEFKNR
jgi:hypothetical protein